jgi:hypothetical protein
MPLLRASFRGSEMNSGGRRQAIEDLTGRRSQLAARARSWPIGTRIAAAVCGLLVVFVLAGCGSSSPSSSSATTSESPFIAEANGACRTAYAKVSALHPSNGSTETPAQIETYVPKLAVIAQAMLGRLTALTPPAAQQAEYNRMLNAWRDEISTALVRGQAAKAGETSRANEAKAKLLTLADEFDAAATRVGLTVCAANP